MSLAQSRQRMVQTFVVATTRIKTATTGFDITIDVDFHIEGLFVVVDIASVTTSIPDTAHYSTN